MKFSDSAFRLSQDLERLGGTAAAIGIAEQAAGLNNINMDIERLSGASATRSIAEQLAHVQNSLPSKALIDALISHEHIALVSSRSHFGQVDSAIEALSKRYGMLDSLRSASLGLLGSDVLKSLSKSQAARVDLGKLLNVDTSAMATISRQIKDSLSISALAEANANSQAAMLAEQFTRIQQSYTAAMPSISLASELVNSIGVLTSLQDQIGQLKLPTIDWVAATAVARLWGTEGIRDQLEAFGISDDGSLQTFGGADSDIEIDGRPRTGRHRPELTVLLGIILALLVTMYQAQSASQLQPKVGATLIADGSVMQAQMRTLEALSRLVAPALQAEVSRKDTRFVVQERRAWVYVSPASGAAVAGALFPREVVSLVSEEGKWIQVSYFDWEHREYRMGWVLKKYLKRVPATREGTSAAEGS